MGNLKDKDLRLMVLKNLIRVLKQHRLYHIFRCSINTSSPRNPYSVLKLSSTDRMRHKIYGNTDNMFRASQKVSDIITMMERLKSSEGGDLNDQGKVQFIITNHINNLIHYCVEKGVRDLSILETLGRETFDMTCKKIYGDDFVEIELKPTPQSKLAKLVAEKGIGGLRDSGINPSDFVDMLSSYSNPFIDSVFNDNIGRRRDDGYMHTNSFFNVPVWAMDDDHFRRWVESNETI